MRIHYFQHVPFEGPAMIADWAKARRFILQGTHFYDPAHTLPDMSDYDALIIMGGPMGVYDGEQHAWLAAEKRHIRAAIDAGKYVLGICLGAQLIADALGAAVKPHAQKEIGWYPIHMRDEALAHPVLKGLDQHLTVLHWHADRFEIPAGAISMAHSQACDCQGFIYQDKVIGLQFHLEMDAQASANIIRACASDLTPAPYVQDQHTIMDHAQKHNLRPALSTLLDNWLREA